MQNFAYVENGKPDSTPAIQEWHLGHAIGMLMGDPLMTGKYTVKVSHTGETRTSEVYFGHKGKWRVQEADLDQGEVSDGEARYTLHRGKVVEQMPNQIPIEVWPAYSRGALVWGRKPWDEWRLREGVEKNGNVLTVHLERRLTPEVQGTLALDIETGFMLEMVTPNRSIRVTDLAFESMPAGIFSSEL